MKSLTIAMICGLVALPAAAEQQLPDATDLRAAYCARLLLKQRQNHATMTDAISGLSDSDAKRKVLAGFRETEERHDRVLAYLKPRLSHLDVVPLAAAAKQADTDVETNRKIVEDARCSEKEGAEATTCSSDALAQSPVRSKQRQCANLDWLPF